MKPLYELRSDARAAVARGDVLTARAALLLALGHTIAREDEYVSVTADMRALLAQSGDFRGALTVDWYAGTEGTQRSLIAKVPPVDRATTLLSWAERATDKKAAAQLLLQAAGEFESAGLIARAAIARERAQDFSRARALWSRLAEVLTNSRQDFYAAGLARFNLARTCKEMGDSAAARSATVESVHLLEEAADHYESVGQRERSFDCFQVLIAIGRHSGEFEHVLEGYVNTIRILREDHLRYYALQSYEEAVAAAEKQGEAAAAATLAREMASYAKKEGFGSIANFGALAQARLWREVAQQNADRGAPPEISENAMLASILAFGEVGQFQRVAGLYRDLASLDLPEPRKKRYQRAASRYENAADQRMDASPLPSHLRHDAGYPEVWHVDLVEWEQRGSVSEACADVILDGAWTDVTRRRALVARLHALAFEDQLARGLTDAERVSAYCLPLIEQLALVELYPILSPLEKLAQRPEVPVRAAAMRALGRFQFKRTFITLRHGLADRDPDVAEAAASAVEEMRFHHAFDPLARIVRESTAERAKAAGLKALGRIDSAEAAELMLSVLEHEGEGMRSAAVDSLKRARGSRFVDLARAELHRLSGQPAQAVREILAARGFGA